MAFPKTLTQSEAEERLAYWQPLLRLSDWHIRIRVVRGVVTGGALGRAFANQMRDGEVLLKDPIDIDFSGIHNADMEVTLVHELLHLRFWWVHDSIEKDTPEHFLEESAIEATAQALVYINRRAQAALTPEAFNPGKLTENGLL